ncbi:uncharacterized protein knop1 isoform X2 [Festucalex cinctus]
MKKVRKADSDEVVFVSERVAPTANMTIVIDQVKRLALQRDIDQESFPKQLSESNHRCALLQNSPEKMKIKTEAVTDENVGKKNKKHKQDQTSPSKMNKPTIADETVKSVEKKKNKVKIEESVIKMQLSLEVGGEEKEKKKKKVVNGSVIDGNGKETKINKKLTDSQKGTEKTTNKKKSKNKTPIEHQNVSRVDEKAAKKAKKEKNEVEDKKVAKKAKNYKNEDGNEKVAKKTKEEKNEVHVDKVVKKAKKEKNEVHDEKMKKDKKEKNEIHDEKVAKKIKKEKDEIHEKVKKAKKERNDVHDEKVKKDKKEKNEIHDEKVTKNLKKEKNDVHYMNGSHLTDDSAVIKKVKKKQEKEKSEHKKKKMKNKVTQAKHENVEMREEAEKMLKKAKKGPNTIPVVSADDNIKHKVKRKKDIAEQNETTVRKKKKTAKLKLSDSEVATKTPEGQEVGEVKLKKKRKSSPHNTQAEDSIKEEAQKEEKNTKSVVGIEEGETKQKKKGEKPKKRKSSELGETESEKNKQKVKKPKSEETEYQEPSKKSRKKASEVKEEKLLEEEYPDLILKKEVKKKEAKKKEAKGKVKKGVKKLKKEAKEEVKKKVKKELKRKEVKKKNKAIKDEFDNQDALEADVVFLSEKTGNTDEVNINQERRQALQIEVDEASRPQKGFGQWSTAQFESSQQQQKFLKLMGGFKNGFQPTAAANTPKPNMALGKDAQEQLQQGLMGEFERAHSRRIDFNGRGAGLGFSEASKKKFAIDVNSCRSVRFDD